MFICRPRFGLFSQPASNAIGDDAAFKGKPNRKDPETEKVITELPNFYTTRLKKGSIDKVLFSKPGYNCLGDPYTGKVFKGGRTYEYESYKKAGHDLNFKLTKHITEKVPKKPAYEWKPDPPEVKKAKKDEDGKVITENPNFYTCPMKKGRPGAGRGTSFGGVIPHLPEDPDAERKMTAKERAYHYSKL